MDLYFFFPEKPFSSGKMPQELENYHPENDEIQRTVIPWKTRRCLKDLVTCLTGQSFKSKMSDVWGVRGGGEIQRILFPTLFPTRCEMFKERDYIVNINIELDIDSSDTRNDRVAVTMTALKDRGNALLKIKKYNEAIFAYTLAALKIENVGVDENDPTLKEIAAHCHCNITLVKLTTNSSLASLSEAIQCCTFAIHLMPTWGNLIFVAVFATRNKDP